MGVPDKSGGMADLPVVDFGGGESCLSLFITLKPRVE